MMIYKAESLRAGDHLPQQLTISIQSIEHVIQENITPLNPLSVGHQSISSRISRIHMTHKRPHSTPKSFTCDVVVT